MPVEVILLKANVPTCNGIMYTENALRQMASLNTTLIFDEKDKCLKSKNHNIIHFLATGEWKNPKQIK